MMKPKLLSIILLIVVFFLGLSVSYLFRERLQFPSCSFNAADKIVPLINQQYGDATLNAISDAKYKIDIVMYEMKFYTTNNSVRRLEDLLVEKSRQGVSVNVFLEQGEWQKITTELTKENMKSADYLRENGVKVKFDSIKTTTHDKLIVIDDETVIIGSHNWGYSAFEKNNEASVLIRSREIASYYDNYFENLWNQF